VFIPGVGWIEFDPTNRILKMLSVAREDVRLS
jgi:transglutaminase-like putative cysteine protease